MDDKKVQQGTEKQQVQKEKVQQGIEKQKVQKEVKRRTQTSRQRIQERTREYGTLTNALLNGSLTKWIFMLILLVGSISAFNSISEDHWIDISIENGQQVYTFNEDAYQLDYTSYSVIGDSIISNFEGITNTLNLGIKTYETIRAGIDGFYNFLQPTVFEKIESGYLTFIERWFGWFEQFRRD
jgi:hypothetical protein